MIEVFAGYGVLCATAKQSGLLGSIAVDKVRKQGAYGSILQLDLRDHEQRLLLEEWLDSPLCCWLHLAPVCGTASRARDIRRHWSDPPPLRSNDFPHGLPNLPEKDQARVIIANDLFAYSCTLFERASRRGILTTMENPSTSYFWLTDWFERLKRSTTLVFTDFQVCMYSGTRPKWTRFVGNFAEITQLDARCDNSHKHEPWRFAIGPDGQKVWATSLESKYPQQLCLAVLQCVLQALHQREVVLRPTHLQAIQNHPLFMAKNAQIAAGQQPRSGKLPHLIPDFPTTAVFWVPTLSDVPCNLLGKLSSPLSASTLAGEPVQIPSFSRYLRSFSLSTQLKGDWWVERL